MKAKTFDGRETDLKQEIIDDFRKRLKGPLLLQGDPGYEESRSVWNALIDRRPSIIVRCLGTADVIECVKFAREHSLLLSIKDGGHNIAGLAVADGALMLDMSLMRGVWVYPAKKIAHAQAGCLISDVDRETQIHGLAAVLGFVSQTGITGLTLGGGNGYLTRRRGWTTDNVEAFNLVTYEGKLVRATNSENPDLFWGLSGGGGNFGVVTGIDYKLYPVGPEIIGGMVVWDISEAPKVLEFYRTFGGKAPRELTLVAFLRPAPQAPWLPKEIHGKPVVGILACYSGNPEEGEKIVAPLKEFGKPAADILGRMPYTQLQSIMDSGQPKGRRYYWKSEYLPAVEQELCERLVVHSSSFPTPYSALILFQLEGAINEYDDDHSPAGNRDAHYLFNITGSWEHGVEDTRNIEWVRGIWNDLKKFGTGGNYINFQTEDDDHTRIEAALGKNLQRLAEIKAKWDPYNFFRTNRNIQPIQADK